VAFTEDENRRILAALDVQMQASLALSRVTLCALAALSPLLGSAIEATLEEELDPPAGRGGSAAQQALDIVEDVLARLQRAPAEARAALALEQALVDAASALSEPDIRLVANAGCPHA